MAGIRRYLAVAVLYPSFANYIRDPIVLGTTSFTPYTEGARQDSSVTVQTDINASNEACDEANGINSAAVTMRILAAAVSNISVLLPGALRLT